MPAPNADVENLWTNGEFPVEQRTTKFFFDGIAPDSTRRERTDPPSYFVSLVPLFAVRRISAAPLLNFLLWQTVVRHRFERIIAGRTFVIEVTWVSDKRWRAHIVRIPGVPTAMMPFYGETPDEAAAHLGDWLCRAHQQQVNTV